MKTNTNNYSAQNFYREDEVSYDEIMRNRKKYPPNYSRNYHAEARVWWMAFAAGFVGFLLCGFPAVGTAIELISNPQMFSKTDYLIPIVCGGLSLSSLYAGTVLPVKYFKRKTRDLANR